MTFPQLQYLLEIHRTGSVTQAAKNLYVSQSSVSIALSALEKELGFPIFIRSKKGLTPTERGVNVIRQAAAICESQQQMIASPQDTHTRVRVSCIPMPPNQKAFYRLVEENKDRQDISFAYQLIGDSLHSVKYFNIELAFQVVISPHLLSVASNITNEGIAYMEICRFPGAIKIGKGHRLYHAENISLKDLENDLFIDSPTGAVSRSLLTAGIISIDPKRNITISRQPILTDQLISSGLAYSTGFYLPSMINANPDIRYVPLKELEYIFIAIYNPQRPMLPEVSRYLDLVREEFKLEGL